MKVSVAQSALLRALDYVGVAIGKVAGMPILGNVRLCAADGELVIEATDLGIMARASVPADVSVSGSTTIGCRRLRDYAAKLDGDGLDISVSPEHWATITSGRARARVAGCSPDTFPDAPGGRPEPLFSIDSATFARMIKQVRFAISREQSRFTIDGARLEVDADQIEMVATDGHRLAHARSKAAGSSGAAPRIISSQALAAILKLVDVSGGGELSVSETSTEHLVFELAGQRLLVRPLSGHFPEWRKVLLSEFDGVAVCDRLSFARAVERVAMFADERSARVDLHVGDGAITVAGATSDRGEGHETVDAEVINARVGGLDIAISGQYLLDALKCSAAERMRLRFTDTSRAIEVSPFGDAAHRTVIMPMRA